MKWYEIYDSVFFLTLGTMIIGVVGLIVRYSYRSRCTRIKCLCMEIERDVAKEVEADLQTREPSMSCREESKSAIG